MVWNNSKSLNWDKFVCFLSKVMALNIKTFSIMNPHTMTFSQTIEFPIDIGFLTLYILILANGIDPREMQYLAWVYSVCLESIDLAIVLDNVFEYLYGEEKRVIYPFLPSGKSGGGVLLDVYQFTLMYLCARC